MITVLYEDALGVGLKNFGPHALVLSCVADRLGDGRDHWQLARQVEAVPKKGNAKLRVALREEPWADRGPLIAVFDEDRVRQCYGLASTACKADVLASIRACSRDAPCVVLLERNMEDVTSACCIATGRPLPPGEAEAG